MEVYNVTLKRLWWGGRFNTLRFSFKKNSPSRKYKKASKFYDSGPEVSEIFLCGDTSSFICIGTPKVKEKSYSKRYFDHLLKSSFQMTSSYNASLLLGDQKSSVWDSVGYYGRNSWIWKYFLSIQECQGQCWIFTWIRT